MKNIAIIIGSLGLLAGCAAPGPTYTNQAYAQPADPSQWRVVSVTPVPVGTGARVAASGQGGVTSTPAPSSTWSTTSVQPVYGQQPVYVQQQQPVYVQQAPVYVPQPVYVEQPRYWYPPISIGLGFDFGRSSWGGGHRHRGWGGHIGTRFPYRGW
jgi:hypothetical protein